MVRQATPRSLTYAHTLINTRAHLITNRYSEAIVLCNGVTGFFGNRAAAFARLGLHEDAVRDCNLAIRIDPLYSKGFGRMGMSLKALGRVADAREAFARALELDPGNVQYKEAMSLLTSATSTPPGASSLDAAALQPSPRMSVAAAQSASSRSAPSSTVESAATAATAVTNVGAVQSSSWPRLGTPTSVGASSTPGASSTGAERRSSSDSAKTATRSEVRRSSSDATGAAALVNPPPSLHGVVASAAPEEERGRRFSVHLPRTALRDLRLELLPARERLYGTVVAIGKLGPLVQVR